MYFVIFKGTFYGIFFRITEAPPPIVQTYAAKEAYGMADFTPESWKQLSLRYTTLVGQPGKLREG